MSDDPTISTQQTDNLARHMRRTRPSLLQELCAFLLTNKKWWLAPIIVVFLLVSALVLLSGTAAAPFIYTLF